MIINKHNIKNAIYDNNNNPVCIVTSINKLKIMKNTNTKICIIFDIVCNRLLIIKDINEIKKELKYIEQEGINHNVTFEWV